VLANTYKEYYNKSGKASSQKYGFKIIANAKGSAGITIPPP
jgi:hypothetical protein